ncbi:MAG TPA: aminomethyl-transferring glycine dehydrogenase subunit GcvPB, partial [Planctomycetota bacterium]|nr:aminomethyl-transferring glycine dehydrogenase subunit GcvPB [Planctomycetota bacterium]
MKTIFEKSHPGRSTAYIAAAAADEKPAASFLPAGALRTRPPGLPEVSELEIVRHFTELSHRTFSIDGNFYPLGSCTMKYNPKINEKIAAMPGFAKLHPLQGEDTVQGLLEVMWNLERMLAEISGMEAVTLQPAAGAQGELTGLLMIRAYLASQGNARHKVLIPDSAHGTNPASVVIAGYEVQNIKSNSRGQLDTDHLR